MDRPMKRPSTFEEILTRLAASGRPVTVGDALLVMVEEMNEALGTNIKATKRDLGPQTDVERRADIEQTLALMNQLRLRFGNPPDGAKGGGELSTVLERCALAGIRLWLEGPALRYDAPKGAMTEELAADIKADMHAILAKLAAAAAGQPPAPVNLDEVLAAACAGVEGITPEVFRSLLSPEDLADIEAGDIRVETLRAYALSFAEGLCSGRIAVP